MPTIVTLGLSVFAVLGLSWAALFGSTALGQSAPPTVTLSISPDAITIGGSTTLTWNATNASSCIASRSWGGARPISGSQTLVGVATSSVYSLTCIGDFGSTTKSVALSVSPIPPPSFSVLSPVFRTNMFFNADNQIMGPIKDIHAEATPWALANGVNSTFFLVSTYHSYLCKTADNIFVLTSEKRIVDTGTCARRQQPGLTATTTEMTPWWKRDYHGAMSGHVVNLAPLGGTGRRLYTINHDEVKNNAALYLPNGCVFAPDFGYGVPTPCVRPSGGLSFQASYNAGISMSFMPWTTTTSGNTTPFTDLGPIAWPSNGYVETIDGRVVKATDGGVREPSSIILDNHLYVFYRDLSQGSESEGRGPGIKVMRAKLTSAGVDPKSYKTYYNGAWSDFALPSGFSMAQYQDFYSQKGGRSSNVLSDVPTTLAEQIPGTGRELIPSLVGQRQFVPSINFSVARIANTRKFVGVENRRFGGLYLRISNDLVHWSPGILIPGTEEPPPPVNLLTDIPLFYPRFMNADGNNNNLIDPNNFYIVGMQNKSHGTGTSTVMNALQLKLTAF